MLRNTIRVFAILFLIGSIVVGAMATYVWLTPSDEQRAYDQAYREAEEKLRKLEAAKGTPAEARLAKEFKEAINSVDVWRRGYTQRARWNLMGVLASSGVAFISFIVLLLTFIKRRNSAEIAHAGDWNPEYAAQSGLGNQQPPRY